MDVLRHANDKCLFLWNLLDGNIDNCFSWILWNSMHGNTGEGFSWILATTHCHLFLMHQQSQMWQCIAIRSNWYWHVKCTNKLIWSIILFIFFCAHLKHSQLLNDRKKIVVLTFLSDITSRIVSWIMADWFSATGETTFLTGNVETSKGGRHLWYLNVDGMTVLEKMFY
jgi:hypothetical protein